MTDRGRGRRRARPTRSAPTPTSSGSARRCAPLAVAAQALAGRPDQARHRRQRAGPQHPGARRRRRVAVELVTDRRDAAACGPPSPTRAPASPTSTWRSPTAGPAAPASGSGCRGARRLVDEFELRDRPRRRAPTSRSSSGRDDGAAGGRPSRQRGRRLAPGRGRERGRRCAARAVGARPSASGFDRERASARSASSRTELATNLVKHAGDGVVLLRAAAPRRHSAGVELVAVDAGPGMRDLTPLFADGHSTAGTLGIGLGAVAGWRAATTSHSVAGQGTVVAAHVLAGRARPPARGGRPHPRRSRARRCAATPTPPGRTTRGYLLHGQRRPRARPAGRPRRPASASAVFLDSEPESPAALLERVHRALTGTRGAAAAVAELDLAAGRLTYAGRRQHRRRGRGQRTQPRGHGLVPGIVGHNLRDPSGPDLRRRRPAPGGACTATGSPTSGTSADYPGLLGRSPLVSRPR